MTKRTTIVLAVIASALLVYILAYEQTTLSSGELEGRQGRLIEQFVREQVTRIAIERQDERFVLERGELDDSGFAAYRLVEPVEAACDDDAIDSLLGALEWADSRRTIEGVSADDRADFGFDEPFVSATITVANLEIPITVGGEDPQETGRYLMLGDESVVYVVGRDVFEALDHDSGHFRDKELLREVAPERATRIELAGAWTIEKQSGAYRVTAPFSALAAQGRVSELLGQLAEFRAQRFVAEVPDDLSAYGLDSPVHTISLLRSRGEDDDVTAQLTVGGACEDHDDEVYARVDEGPVVCVLGSVFEGLATDASTLRELRLMTVPDGEVARVVLSRGAQRLELARHAEEGTFELVSADDQRTRADDGAVAELMSSLRATTAVEVVSTEDVAAAGIDFTREQARLVIERTDEEGTEELVFVGLDGESIYARREGDDAVLRLEPEAATVLDPSALRFLPRSLIDEEDQHAVALSVRRGAVTEQASLSDGQWRLLAPQPGNADRVAPRRLSAEIASLSALRFVAEQPASEHGLATPRAVVEARFEGSPSAEEDEHGHEHEDGEEGDEDAEPRTYTVAVGGDTDGGAFARLGDGPVFVLSESTRDALLSPLFDRSILATPMAQVEAITIERNGVERGLRRQGDGWQTLAGEAADRDAARALLERLAGLRASTVVYQAAPVGAAPQARVTITRADDSGSYSFTIGASVDDESVAVYPADANVTLRLPAEAVEPFVEF